MAKDLDKKKLIEHLKGSVDEHGLLYAFGKMEQWRIPLREADRDIYDTLTEQIEEYCNENNIENYYDTEDIAYELV